MLRIAGRNRPENRLGFDDDEPRSPIRPKPETARPRTLDHASAASGVSPTPGGQRVDGAKPDFPRRGLHAREDTHESGVARFSHHSFRRAFFSLGMRQAGGLWVCGDLGVGATAVGRRMTGFFGLRGPAGARILRRRCSAGSSFATLNGSRGAVCDPAVRSAAVSNAAAPAFGDFPTVRAGSPRFCGTVPDTDTPATTSRTPAAC